MWVNLETMRDSRVYWCVLCVTFLYIHKGFYNYGNTMYTMWLVVVSAKDVELLVAPIAKSKCFWNFGIGYVHLKMYL